jgi:hypothetical protein
MRQMADENNFVSGVVKVTLDEVIKRDLEGFLDLVSTRLTGSELLMEIGYQVVGHQGDTLLIKVRGQVDQLLELEEELKEEEAASEKPQS